MSKPKDAMVLLDCVLLMRCLWYFSRFNTISDVADEQTVTQTDRQTWSIVGWQQRRQFLLFRLYTVVMIFTCYFLLRLYRKHVHLWRGEKKTTYTVRGKYLRGYVKRGEDAEKKERHGHMRITVVTMETTDAGGGCSVARKSQRDQSPHTVRDRLSRFGDSHCIALWN